MSLINDMLRDLEARRAGELDKPAMQRQIRALPERPRRFPELDGRKAVLVLLSVAVGGAAIGWVSGLWSKKESRPAAAVQTAAVVPPAVQAMPVLQPLPAPSQKPVGEPSLALATDIGLPGREAGIASADGQAERQLPATPRKTEKQKPAPDTSGVQFPAGAAHPSAAAPEAGGNPRGTIEKTPAQGTPRERADAEYRRAQALAAGGSSGGVVQDALQAALRQDGSFTPARQALLKLLLDARRFDEALGVLQEGLELQPAQIGWAISLARLQVERGDLTGAERTLARSRAHGAANPEYVGFHGYVLNRLGRFREAFEQYHTAARLAPGEGRWWFGIGQALEGDGRPQEAKAAFRRALDAGNLSGDLTVLAEQKAR